MRNKETQKEYCKSMYKVKSIKEEILRLQTELMEEEKTLHEIIDDYITEMGDL